MPEKRPHSKALTPHSAAGKRLLELYAKQRPMRELDEPARNARKVASDFDRRKSLQQLDGQKWGEPIYPSYLVTTCYTLRHKPLVDFTNEDLRIMIGQGLSLPYLTPIALEHLQEDILASGDLYEGDLLNAVVGADASFWNKYSQYKERLLSLLQDAITPPPDFDSLGWRDQEKITRDIGYFAKVLKGLEQVLSKEDNTQ